MDRSQARRLMAGYIANRVRELSEPEFCRECVRLDEYRRSYRRERGFPEDDPRTGKIHLGLLSDLPTAVDLPAVRQTEEIKIEEWLL